MRVIIAGGGITGLTCALTLLDDVAEVEVTVVEAGDRLGGRILTAPFADRQVDAAADAFLARVPDAIALCERLGLTAQMVTPAERTAYLYARGELRRFPEGGVLGVPTDLDALAASGVISPAGVERAALDLTMGPDPVTDPGDGDGTGGDESVGSLVRRRLGDEVYEVLVGPLLSGVNAGNADELSVAAGAPQFAAAMRDHGSLIAGARAQRAAASRAGNVDAPVFYGLEGGMGTLVDALAAEVAALGGTITLGTSLDAVRPLEPGERGESGDPSDPGDPGESGRSGRPLEVTMGEDTRVVDAVVLATPLDVTARLLDPLLPEVARAMAEVDYASAVMVTLAVPKDQIDHPLDASGFLVPHREGMLLTACSWASVKWAHLDAPDVAILRASAGRHGDHRAFELDDDALVDALLDDLAITMGLRGRPIEARVTRWPTALPQFRPGHLQRVAEWRTAMHDVSPGLVATGAGFEGLGIPACIRQGRETAKMLSEQHF